MSTSQKKTDIARYDRQIRLWGEDGQRSLEECHICLLNASATGTETLKNLVLPGIGCFTIIDGKKVTETDLGNNFFVTEEKVGSSRAATACELLQELNFSEDPTIFSPVGKFVDKDPIELINSDIHFFKQFTLIIATELNDEHLLKLSEYAYHNNIPLIVVRSYGFIGYIRIVVPEHAIVQSKLDNPPDDLRLYEPWKELSDYAASFDIDNLEGGAHSHVPYIIILLNYLTKWKNSHNGNSPQNYQEKSQFKRMVLDGQKNPDEENFSEAHRAAHKAFSPYEIPSDTLNILNDSKCNVNSNSSNFWILASALKQFLDNDGSRKYLPLNGSIPDMTSTTEGYIALQKIYQEKANKELEQVIKYVRETLTKIGKSEDSISKDEIKAFCKNARALRLLRYSTLQFEYDPKSPSVRVLENHLNDPTSNFNWYVLLRAVGMFQSKYKRVPGDTDDHVVADRAELKQIVNHFLQERNIKVSFDEKYVDEMVRFGAAELHNLASFMGGVASQEAIKLITHQYVPVSNTFIFNGLSSTSCKDQF